MSPASSTEANSPPPESVWGADLSAANLSYIAESIRRFAVPIETVKPDPANARAHGDRNRRVVRNLLERLGQRKLLVVNRRSGIVYAGNLRLEEAKALGWTHVAVLLVDEPPIESAAFGVADNRTAELAEWDTRTLSTMLEHLGVDLSADLIGWSDEEVQNIATSAQRPTKPKDSNIVTIRLNREDREALEALVGILNMKRAEVDWDEESTAIEAVKVWGRNHPER